MAWFRLAARLGMSVQRCQRETTSTEFLEWQDYFTAELKIPEREHHYLAQIACEVRRGNAKEPQKVKFDDFMMKYTPQSAAKAPLTPAEKQLYLARSKAAWLGVTQALSKRKLPSRSPPKKKE